MCSSVFKFNNGLCIDHVISSNRTFHGGITTIAPPVVIETQRFAIVKIQMTVKASIILIYLIKTDYIGKYTYNLLRKEEKAEA